MTHNPLLSPWLPRLLVGSAGMVALGYLMAVYSISRWLTKPTRGAPKRTPSDHGLDWEPLDCRTADGLRLEGWVVAPAAPLGTVVLFHGIRNTREQTLSRTAFLVDEGFRCVAFDHRAHGRSGGRRSSFGYFESLDVAAVLRLVRQRWPGEPVAVLGISMGAAAVCFAADEVRSSQAVILESLYHDLGSAFRNRLQSRHYPPWFRRLSRGIVWMTERRLGVGIEKVAPAEHIGKLAPAPVLILTGAEDAHAPPTEAEQLHLRCQGPGELWLVPRAGHRDVFETGPEEYRQRIVAFLNQWMSSALPGPHPRSAGSPLRNRSGAPGWADSESVPEAPRPHFGGEGLG